MDTDEDLLAIIDHIAIQIGSGEIAVGAVGGLILSKVRSEVVHLYWSSLVMIIRYNIKI